MQSLVAPPPFTSCRRLRAETTPGRSHKEFCKTGRFDSSFGIRLSVKLLMLLERGFKAYREVNGSRQRSWFASDLLPIQAWCLHTPFAIATRLPRPLKEPPC